MAAQPRLALQTHATAKMGLTRDRFEGLGVLPEGTINQAHFAATAGVVAPKLECAFARGLMTTEDHEHRNEAVVHEARQRNGARETDSARRGVSTEERAFKLGQQDGPALLPSPAGQSFAATKAHLSADGRESPCSPKRAASELEQ